MDVNHAELIKKIELSIESTKEDPNATFIQRVWKARGQEAVLDLLKDFLTNHNLLK
jgi:hypothetical protein